MARCFHDKGGFYFRPRGWQMDQTVEMVEYLKDRGIDVNVAKFYGALIKRVWTEYEGDKDEFVEEIERYVKR